MLKISFRVELSYSVVKLISMLKMSKMTLNENADIKEALLLRFCLTKVVGAHSAMGNASSE